jgi:hypothetical protein
MEEKYFYFDGVATGADDGVLVVLVAGSVLIFSIPSRFSVSPNHAAEMFLTKQKIIKKQLTSKLKDG